MNPFPPVRIAPARHSHPSDQAAAQTLDFTLPRELEAAAPPEARGLTRDGVRLMVSYRGSGRIEHARFYELDRFLVPGDVLVINTSGTLNAALAATRHDGEPFVLHLSTRLPADLWVVEVRQPAGSSTEPFFTAQPGDRFSLPAGGRATLLAAYLNQQRHRGPKHGDPEAGRVRLWIASLDLPCDLFAYLAEQGAPIRYSYVDQPWPSAYYQTVYATEPGSAEMPSAGRAFTPEGITRLVSQGVQIAPLILHTGVASLEKHEPPYAEAYRVPVETAALVTAARQEGRRVIAVGTTVVRALETVTLPNGITYPGAGWTELVITPERGIRAVNALLTGLHEPEASHLALLEALAGREHVAQSYAAALAQRYLWHEFGDLHLILP